MQSFKVEFLSANKNYFNDYCKGVDGTGNGTSDVLSAIRLTPDTPIVSVVEMLITAAAVSYIPNKGKDVPVV